MIVFPRLEDHPYLSETIYNLVEPEISKSNQVENSRRYRSRHHASTKEEQSAAKSSIPRTMGYVQTPLNSPQDYLKKHSREAKMATDLNKSVTCSCRSKSGKVSPTFPKPQQVFSIPIVERNFVRENIVEVLKRPHSTPTARVVDSRRGDAFVLVDSGWLPKYSCKQDYGKVPKYIERLQQNLRESREKFVAAEHRQGEPEKLSAKTKKKILEDLVLNLKELLRRYLTLPLKIDTPAQIKRKNDLEDMIDALQRDIDLIQSHKEILIGRTRSGS